MFALTQIYIQLLSFSGVNDESITYGTASVTIAGTLAAGLEIPVGGIVAVTLNGDEQDPAATARPAASSPASIPARSRSWIRRTASVCRTREAPRSRRPRRA